MKFAKYTYTYPAFEKDFQESGLSTQENVYYDVQDFKWLKQEKSPNFTIIS